MSLFFYRCLLYWTAGFFHNQPCAIGFFHDQILAVTLRYLSGLIKLFKVNVFICFIQR